MGVNSVTEETFYSTSAMGELIIVQTHWIVYHCSHMLTLHYATVNVNELKNFRVITSFL